MGVFFVCSRMHQTNATTVIVGMDRLDRHKNLSHDKFNSICSDVVSSSCCIRFQYADLAGSKKSQLILLCI